MASDIESTLKELDKWYNELPGGSSERPNLLSKLATLEYCGWLEMRLDELVRSAGNVVGIDGGWTETSVIQRTHGFKYSDHFRPMICSLLGEFCVKQVEARLESIALGDIERLKNILASLWLVRGQLAHTNLAGTQVKQLQIFAPSWSINQQRVVSKILSRYETELLTVARQVRVIV